MPSLKIVLLGDMGTGKSCLLQYYLTNRFFENCAPTNNVACHIVRFDHETLLNIFDPSGALDSPTVFHFLLHDAHTVVVSVELPYPGDPYLETEYLKRCKSHMEKWIGVCQTYARGTPIILSINKSDLFKRNKFVPPINALDALVKKEFGVKELCVTSAKGNDHIDGINVRALFSEVCKYALEYYQTKFNITQPVTSSVPKATKNLQRKLKRSSGWGDWIWLIIAGLVIATLWFILFPPASLIGFIAPIALGMELGNLGILLLAAEAALAVGLCAWVVYEIAKWTFGDAPLDILSHKSPEKPAQKRISSQSSAPVQIYTAMPATSHLFKQAPPEHGETGVKSTTRAVKYDLRY